jgi:capsular exopolysaccharide synthesis family protein
MQRELEELPQLERDLLTRMRPLKVREQMYEYLVKLEKESEVARKSLQPMVHLLDPAEVSYVRASPILTRNALLALMAGLVAAVAATFLVEYMDRSVKSPQELEQGLGLPIYAAIPAFASVRRRERRRLEGPLVVRDQPSSVLAEAYRSLRANIRFAQGDRTIKTLAITSSVEQEGKTVTTLNLAIAMAHAGDRVIVVDADMRRPTTHVHLDGDLEPGLVDVLRGEAAWKDVVHETDVEGLHAVHAGREPQNPGALLDSAAFTALLQDLRARYDYVLFDVPPVLAVADAAAFFRQLDGIFLLSRYRRCSLDLVDGAREQIERLGGRILGAIFNGFDARRSARRGYGYYGYYGYYSRYGGYGRRSSTREERRSRAKR